MDKIKTLIIDDSTVVQLLLAKILEADPEIEVVDVAKDPIEARQKIKQHNPDVLTLDIEMPRMDGLTFLEKLMRLRPMPVIMISALTNKSAVSTLRAMELGAVDFIPKPKVGCGESLEHYSAEIIRKVKSASRTNVSALTGIHEAILITDNTDKQGVFQPEKLGCNTNIHLAAIGSSTGGTEAVASILKVMPTDFPGIVITQHIPPKFSKAFAERVNDICEITVEEAVDGQKIETGHAYVAPGGYHMEVIKDRLRYVCRVYEGERVNRHCPSVEVLFQSVAQNVGPNVISVMLTGMGKDGSTGMQEINNIGGRTIAQNEETSVVWGMPGAVVKLGCVDKVLPLNDIPAEMIKICRKEARKSFRSIANG